MKTFICICFFLTLSVDDPSHLLNAPVQSFQAIAEDSAFIDAAYLEGKVTIIAFYSHSCSPCRAEMPFLSEPASDLGGKGLQVLVVTTDSQRKIRKHFNSARINDGHLTKSVYKIDSRYFKIVSDKSDAIHKLFGVQPIPATFIVDRKKIVKSYYLGFPDERNEHYERAFIQKVDKILEEV